MRLPVVTLLAALVLTSCEPTPAADDVDAAGGTTASPTATATPAATPTPTPLVVAGYPELVCTWAEVVAVIDGDTLTIRIDGAIDRVRLIGVDAPETNHPTRGADALAPEAAAFVASVAFHYVCLESDITNRDEFERLLRYAWLPDGLLLNEELLRQGLAVMHTYPPDVRHVDTRYLPAQEAARLAGRGVWGLEPTPEGECDPAYPGVCIPPPPPDLDCADVTHRRFTVLPPDPHRFDNDGNGVGCET